MNVVLSACVVFGPTDRSRPLAVSGTVHGRVLEVLVAGLPDVLACIAEWTAQDPDAIGCWGLRADYSETLTIPLRHKVGVVGEGRRTVHLVQLRPGVPHGGTVTALCGERLTVLGAEVLSLGAGMPCDGCLARGLAAEAPIPDRAVAASADLPAVN
ncbi:MAG TPA: hypothetical protein VH352_00525 [Pseudonocardiaceae bacterium]|nr:hypothetical protein [Pseudonocardiaceae bacterium]